MGDSQGKRIKRTQRDYTLGFKLAVVDLVEKGEMTYKQAQRHYGIQGRSTVLVWLRKHGTLDWTAPNIHQHMHKKKPQRKRLNALSVRCVMRKTRTSS